MKGRVILVGAEDEENLALRYLAAVLVKAGHNVKIYPCSNHVQIKGVVQDAQKFRPDLIGVSIAFQSLAHMYFDLVNKLKAAVPNSHITVGGHFPTFEYAKILTTQKGIDSAIRFEGEKPIVDLLEALLGNKDISKVPNLVYLKNGKIKENICICKFPDLDSLPFPIRSRKPLMRLGENFATLVASRGCFHSRCLYCCIGAFHSKKEGAKIALRSPKNIAQEISELYHKKKARLFQFHDDNFMLKSKDETLARFRELKSELDKLGVGKVAFLIKARPDSINKEIADTLLELGVIGIFLGVENASESGLKSLARGTTIRDIENAFKILSKYPFAITFNLLIFHPLANLDEINQNIHFIKNNPEYALDFGRAEIVAGSPLERLVKINNLLQGEWPNWDYKIKDPAVDRLFRINVATFRRKGSMYSRLAHLSIALSYQAYLINRFYPGNVSEKLLQETKDMLRKTNEFILNNILKIYKLAAEEQIQDKIDAVYRDIDEGSSRLCSQIGKLAIKMTRLQVLEKKFKVYGLSLQEYPLISRVFRLS